MTDGESWDPINNLMLKRSKGVGSVERYHENGQLWEKTTGEEYRKNGQLLMKMTTEEYWYDGKLRSRSKGILKDGKLHGPSETYLDDGRLSKKETYKDDQLDGPYEWYYYENGQLKSKGIHKNGLKCGEWFEDGETVTHPPC